jgi:hypothetical protein
LSFAENDTDNLENVLCPEYPRECPKVTLLPLFFQQSVISQNLFGGLKLDFLRVCSQKEGSPVEEPSKKKKV